MADLAARPAHSPGSAFAHRARLQGGTCAPLCTETMNPPQQGVAVLSDDRRLSNVDHSKEPWALRLPPMPVDNGELAGYIEDQQGAFNLNNLVRNGAVSPAQVAHFGRLLN